MNRDSVFGGLVFETSLTSRTEILTVTLWRDDYEHDDVHAFCGSEMSLCNRKMAAPFFQKRVINGTAQTINNGHPVFRVIATQKNSRKPTTVNRRVLSSIAVPRVNENSKTLRQSFLAIRCTKTRPTGVSVGLNLSHASCRTQSVTQDALCMILCWQRLHDGGRAPGRAGGLLPRHNPGAESLQNTGTSVETRKRNVCS